MGAGSMPRPTTRVLLLVSFWFACNVGVLLLNKLLLSTYAFECPITLTALHMCTCVLVTQLALSTPFSLVPREPLRSAKQRGGVLLLSSVFCASVVAGNVSLQHITVSFNQAISSTDPAFTALFALALQGKKETAVTYATLLPVVAGTALASGFEPLYNSLGFAMCLAAAASRALKSVMQEILLSDGDKLHSLNLLAHMSPYALAMLVPLAVLFEPDAIASAFALVSTHRMFAFLLALNCGVAACVNLSNFLVTQATSALTLQVLGKAKSVIAVAASLLMFRNPVSALGMTGYAICLAGVCAYSFAKTHAKGASLSHRASSSGNVAGSMAPAPVLDVEIGVAHEKGT